MGKTQWLPYTTWRKSRLRIICLPDAGGNAASFRKWQDLLPQGVDVAPVELPGHGTRSREAPLHE
jgi:surfactin synthase thioesterase subunit